MKTVLVVLISSLALLAGCSMNPITEGSYKTLPQRNTRVIIWGGHPSATEMAAAWLQKRGLSIIDHAKIQRILSEQGLTGKGAVPNENQIRRIGTLVGAEMVIWVDTPFTNAQPAAPYIVYGGGMVERKVYIANVSIKGVIVETGEIVWSGSARYPGSYDDLDRGLRELTCQALATAWGFRPPGYYSFKSQDMCDL